MGIYDGHCNSFKAYSIIYFVIVNYIIRKSDLKILENDPACFSKQKINFYQVSLDFGIAVGTIDNN